MPLERHDPIAGMLIEDEGLRLKPYRCPAGKLTIGVGRNLDDVGITQEEAMLLLDNDLNVCRNDLRGLFGGDLWDTMAVARRAALTNMRFNLGAAGFRNFVGMIEAVRAGKWSQASAEALDSKWAREDVQPPRSQRIARMLASGEWDR